MLEFGAAERFSMNVADLLQLQGGFLRDGKCRSTAQRDEALCRGERAQSQRPIQLSSRGQPIRQAIESRLADQAVARLLDSEELWLLVEEIAESPAVTDAITQQGFGFADEVAGGMRARSRNADAWLERTARRALRRPPR